MAVGASDSTQYHTWKNTSFNKKLLPQKIINFIKSQGITHFQGKSILHEENLFFQNKPNY